MWRWWQRYTPPSTSTPVVNPVTTPIQATPTSKVTDTYDLWSQTTIDTTKRNLKASAISTPTATINGTAHSTTLELAKLAQGLNTITVNRTAIATIDGQAHTLKVKETLRAYHQPNSIVLGKKIDGATISGPNKNQTVGEDDELEFKHLSGNATKTLPTAGVFNYSGKSFDHDSEGSFDYAIDFAKKTGKGNIALDGKSIVLNESSIGTINNNELKFQGFGVRGQTSGAANGRYTLGIFGDNAEEVAGFAESRDAVIGFGGAKK